MWKRLQSKKNKTIKNILFYFKRNLKHGLEFRKFVEINIEVLNVVQRCHPLKFIYAKSQRNESHSCRRISISSRFILWKDQFNKVGSIIPRN
jgi:hypothetical protein